MTDYSELVKVLRGLANGIWKNCEYTWFGGEEKVFADAADEIEALVKINHRFRELLDNRNKDVAELQRKVDELTSQLPKRGKWVEENRRPRSSQFVCSECHRTAYDPQPTRDKAWRKRCRYAYCPNCGAKMEVHDGSSR